MAFAGGGALETVIGGQTGEFFREQSVESLKQVLAGFDATAYDPGACRSNAERFREERFVDELKCYLNAVQ